jgi:hypothetical protein
VAVALAAAVALAGCSAGGTTSAGRTGDGAAGGAPGAPSQGPSKSPALSGEPLRPGERIDELTMPAAYTPHAPNGVGTDDYRCFVLDPELDQDAFITGIDVLPGNRDVVHHVILFRVPPESIGAATAQDSQEAGPGWTCFGGTGIDSGARLDNAPWLGAWAPGGGEQVLADDVGIPLAAGSKVIMQVHYNLLAGDAPDRTAARLRLAPGDADLAPLQTMLLPAPVELPCRSGHDGGPLCSRNAAVADNAERFGFAAQTANYLHLLCGGVDPGPVQRCDSTITRPTTIRAAAGHMHLLGRSIKIQVDPGTKHARTVLDVPVWDFDNQGARPVRPVRLQPGDTVRVTCRHDQRLRDLLPAFKGQQERYVVWGEGTTDEMCLGLLMVTTP